MPPDSETSLVTTSSARPLHGFSLEHQQGDCKTQSLGLVIMLQKAFKAPIVWGCWKSEIYFNICEETRPRLRVRSLYEMKVWSMTTSYYIFIKAILIQILKCFSNTLLCLVLIQNDHCRNTVIRRNSVVIIIKSKVTFPPLCVLMEQEWMNTEKPASPLGIILSSRVVQPLRSTVHQPEKSPWRKNTFSFQGSTASAPGSSSSRLLPGTRASELTGAWCHSKSKGSKDKETYFIFENPINYGDYWKATRWTYHRVLDFTPLKDQKLWPAFGYTARNGQKLDPSPALFQSLYTSTPLRSLAYVAILTALQWACDFHGWAVVCAPTIKAVRLLWL